jgi:Raf kinase inhibitor-like YbhB/YbcL family protein
MSTRTAVVRLAAMSVFALAMLSGDPSHSAAQRGGGGRGRGGIRTMTLTSSAFRDGGAIPEKHAQAGRDVSPALAWTDAPDSTVSFVLLVHDPDSPIGDGLDDTLHWLVWGIPGNATSLPEGVPQGMQLPITAIGLAAPEGRGGGRGGRGGGGGGGVRQISVSGPYYRGPAAPSTGVAHHYLFELYALDTNINYQPSGQSAGPPTRAAVIEAMRGHIRGRATLVGTYRRPAP